VLNCLRDLQNPSQLDGGICYHVAGLLESERLYEVVWSRSCGWRISSDRR